MPGCVQLPVACPGNLATEAVTFELLEDEEMEVEELEAEAPCLCENKV